MIKNSIKQQGSALIIIIVVLAVGLVGALGFIFWQNVTKTTEQASDSNNTSTSSKEELSTSEVKLDDKDLVTSDNLGITYKLPSTWTGGAYGGGDVLSDSESTTLTSPDGFVITMTISRLIRGWTQDSPTSSVLDVQKTTGTDLSWLVVDHLNDEPISLQISDPQSLPAVGDQKVAGSSIYKLGEVDGSGVYIEVYGKYETDISLAEFNARDSVQQAKAIIESIRVGL